MWSLLKTKKYELYPLGLMSCHFGPLSLAKTKKREEKGKGGREGEERKEKGKKKIQEDIWFVREKWREI